MVLELKIWSFFSFKCYKEFEIPVAGIFVVTNYTNENAHDDFIKKS